MGVLNLFSINPSPLLGHLVFLMCHNSLFNASRWFRSWPVLVYLLAYADDWHLGSSAWSSPLLWCIALSSNDLQRQQWDLSVVNEVIQNVYAKIMFLAMKICILFTGWPSETLQHDLDKFQRLQLAQYICWLKKAFGQIWRLKFATWTWVTLKLATDKLILC